MAMTDAKTWLLMGILYSIYIAGAVTNFFPLSDTLGKKNYGLTAVYSHRMFFCVIAMILNGLHSDKTSARYVAMMLMPGSFYSPALVVLSWVAGTLSQPSIKRASAIAMINAVCNTPNVWTSYPYYSKPRYLTAFLVNLAASGLAIILATVARIYLQRQNIKLNRGLEMGRNGPTPAQIAAGFRYVI
ncbi:hypothetical protein PENDEC_c030G00002 [Penicillium decumbens]|uniref:Major facilitator superfamily (MFS) profile domain-containing protein n=1 Tax=Penicillium decumbens TaxID=69771 RepID=A0A1V6NW57_PENDC|nr:hypothetical protein PENDEC_c030G00002 [Penicillium decumbens]